MFEYTQGNHYRWGWTRQEWFKDKTSADQQFQFSVGVCSRVPQSFREECIRTAQLIASNTSKPLRVLLSGGVDSQVVFLSMVEAQVPFEALIVDMVDDYGNVINGHDTQAAYQLCSIYNKTPLPHTLSWHLPISAAQNSNLIFKTFNVANVHDLSKTFNEFCLIHGAGPQDTLYYLPTENALDLTFSDSISQHTQYAINHNLQAITFFRYTPELMLSMVDNEAMRLFRQALPSMAAAMTHYTGSTVFSEKKSLLSLDLINDWWKPLLMCEQWPEVIQRPKYHGYEQIPEHDRTRARNFVGGVITDNIESSYQHSVVVPMNDFISALKVGDGLNATVWLGGK